MFPKCDSTPSRAAIVPSARRKPDDELVEPDEDEHEHHRHREDERRDLAAREARRPHADARQARGEEPAAHVLREHWFPTAGATPSARPSGIGSVSASAIHRKNTAPANLPSSSSSSVTGCVSTTSSTPLR